jgi:hypothetical protein
MAESFVCVVGGDERVVGGWGSAASERAAVWIGGASAEDLDRAEGLLETVAKQPWPCARGLLEDSEGYRLLQQVHRALFLAVNQWAQHTNTEAPPELSLNPAEACAATEALLRELRPDRDPGLPAPDLEELGKSLETAAAAAKRALASKKKWGVAERQALQAVVRAAGAWADRAEQTLGRAAECAEKAQKRTYTHKGTGR